MASKQPEKKKIDLIIEEYSLQHQNATNIFIQWICIPLLTFGLLGFIWSIPFPHLDFLGRYNGFVNWASFLIAFSIYYYLKLSPILSYGILLIVFGFSAGIVALEKLHNNYSWPTMGSVCFGILVIGLVLQFIGYKSEGKIPGLSTNIQSLLHGPLWLMHMIFKKLGIRI